MFTLFDYLDPQRTEERREAQRDEAARYRAAKENAGGVSTRAPATPLAAERRALLTSLAEMWATKERPAGETDVLAGCPSDVPPDLPRRSRSAPLPVLTAWDDWLPLALVTSGFLLGVLLLLLVSMEL